MTIIPRNQHLGSLSLASRNRRRNRRITAEYFSTGDEIGGQKHMLLDYQRAEFTLTEENDNAFEFSGSPVELLDYTVNNERRGKRYGGFLVVIKDLRNKGIDGVGALQLQYKDHPNFRPVPTFERATSYQLLIPEEQR